MAVCSAVPRPLELLELYCGNGNHTVALARHFHKVLCVEIDKKLCDAADFNLMRNGVRNAHVLCVSSGVPGFSGLRKRAVSVCPSETVWHK